MSKLNNDEVKINEIINVITSKIKLVKKKHKKEESFYKRCKVKTNPYKIIYKKLNYELEYFFKNKIKEVMFEYRDKYLNEIEKIILNDVELSELNKKEGFKFFIEHILYVDNINSIYQHPNYINFINLNITKNKNHLKIIDIVNEYLNDFNYLSYIINRVENDENNKDYFKFIIENNIYFDNKMLFKNFVDIILKADKDFILVFKTI